MQIQRGEVYCADRRLVLVLQSADSEIIVAPVASLHRGNLLDLIRTIDRNSLGRRLYRLSDTKTNEVEQTLHACLGQYYEGRATA